MGFANGSFGELLQGSLPGPENHFLVTLPIHRFSRATFSLGPEDRRLKVRPEGKHKAARFARMLLRQLELPERGKLEIDSELPEGKGMASSSADLVATARATCAALGCSVETSTLLKLLRDLEPTDGVMYPEFVSFFYRRVRLHQRLGVPQRRLKVLAVDEGGAIDTVAYNRRSADYSARDCATYESLLAEICDAFARSDLRAVGAVATRSAVLNQRRNPKDRLTFLREQRRASGAHGLVVTHSGPCAGLLFDDSPAHADAMAATEQTLRDQGLNVFHLSSLDPGTAPPPAHRLVKEPRAPLPADELAKAE